MLKKLILMTLAITFVFSASSCISGAGTETVPVSARSPETARPSQVATSPVKTPGPTPEPTPVREAQGFVNVQALDSSIIVDLKYATSDNCLSKVIYDYNICILRKTTAQKLAAVSKAVARDGYRLKIWDGYRMPSASWQLWNAFKDPSYVSNPDRGDKHCKGTAVDLTLTDMSGREMKMPTGFDDFSKKASGKGSGGEAYKNWQYLRNVMETNGFKGIGSEWWHYNDTDTSEYDVVDINVKLLFK